MPSFCHLKKRILLDLALLFKCPRAEPVLYILCKIVITCISNIFAENLCGLKIQFHSGFWMMYVCIVLCKHYYSAVMLGDFLMIYTLRSYVTYCKSTISANWNILLLLFNNFLFEELCTSANNVLKYFLIKHFSFYVFLIFNFHIVQANDFQNFPFWFSFLQRIWIEVLHGSIAV